MFLSDPPASDLAEALYDEDRESDGYVSNLTRLWCWRPDVMDAFFGVRSLLSSDSNAALGAQPDAQLASAVPAAARAAVSYGRPPAGGLSA
jgi:hypothetical protein